MFIAQESLEDCLRSVCSDTSSRVLLPSVVASRLQISFPLAIDRYSFPHTKGKIVWLREQGLLTPLTAKTFSLFLYSSCWSLGFWNDFYFMLCYLPLSSQ